MDITFFETLLPFIKDYGIQAVLAVAGICFVFKYGGKLFEILSKNISTNGEVTVIMTETLKTLQTQNKDIIESLAKLSTQTENLKQQTVTIAQRLEKVEDRQYDQRK